MTTPDEAHASTPGGASEGDADRERRKELPRAGARRARDQATPPITESVAHAVRTGYDVVSDNIRQGRLAAQRFGSGEYNISDVPNDVAVLTQRALYLARELTATTLDVIEKLVKESRSATADLPTATSETAPSEFAGPSGREAKMTKVAAETPAPAIQRIALIVTFSGPGKEKAADRSSVLLRPEPASILRADPLAAPTGGGEFISGVSFSASASGVVAIVDIPEGQAKGVYSGLIHASGVIGAVGFLSIEVLE